MLPWSSSMASTTQQPLLLPQSSRDLGYERQRTRIILKFGAAAAAPLIVLLVLWGLILISLPSEYSSSSPKMSSHHDQTSSISSSLNFLVVGDWGRKGLYNQSEVATQMGRIGEERSIEFVISVGDNFYNTGLTGEDDPAFTASFTDVYTSPSLQTTWYSVLGNHDYMGDVLSQLSDELVKRDSRWFCRKEFELSRSLCFDSITDGSCNSSVDMFFIDTTPFIDEYWEANETRSFDWRGLAPREQQLQTQLQRLEESLQASNATWKLVFGHHTIRSIGHHGDMIELIQQLLPILEKYGVHAYVNGHDHNLQHIKRADSSVHLFTSGGGSKAYSGLQEYTEEDGVRFAYDGQGFLAIAMDATSVDFTVYDVFGQDIYSYGLAMESDQTIHI